MPTTENGLFPAKEFKEWLKDNEAEFREMPIKDIADRAHLAGYSRIVVAQWESREKFRRAA